MKDQWLHPIEWSQDWRDHGYAVPAAGVFGTAISLVPFSPLWPRYADRSTKRRFVFCTGRASIG